MLNKRGLKVAILVRRSLRKTPSGKHWRIILEKVSGVDWRRLWYHWSVESLWRHQKQEAPKSLEAQGSWKTIWLEAGCLNTLGNEGGRDHGCRGTTHEKDPQPLRFTTCRGGEEGAQGETHNQQTQSQAGL